MQTDQTAGCQDVSQVQYFSKTVQMVDANYVLTIVENDVENDLENDVQNDVENDTRNLAKDPSDRTAPEHWQHTVLLG